MMIVDPIKQGLAQGWQHIDVGLQTENSTLEADVVIVGTGAGGGVAAEMLTAAGFNVLMVEAGSLQSSTDFTMQERNAYPEMYQQAAAMRTKDKAIGIFQGRTVGGSTTINWTTSIRTPEPTLDYWASAKSVQGLSPAQLQPWFEQMEQRLSIAPWPVPPNPNNRILKEGCQKLGWQHTVISRNVAGCWNLGYCGMGCPVNAKQSMLVTTIPEALSKGARLLTRAQAYQLEHHADKATALLVRGLHRQGQPTGVTVTIKAKHYVLAAGAIHTPSLLMRSHVDDPHKVLGNGIFLHPTLLSGAIFDEQVKACNGAPQSIYSDEFVWQGGVTETIGYKLEVPPVHPVLLASKLIGYGQSHAQIMDKFNQLQVTIALIRDGFNRHLPGGKVHLDGEQVSLDYPLDYQFWAATRRALLSMAELQFAAGAKQVLPLTDGMQLLNSWHEAKQAIATVTLAPLKTIVASAHVMGGCAFGEDTQQAWVNSEGRSHYLENVSVLDGSIFPTSLGANPQLSIYAITAKNVASLIKHLRR